MIQKTTKTVEFRRDSRNVFLHVLTSCNLSCKHCYINPLQHGTGLIPLDKMIAWLKFLKAPKTNLLLLGGEPTLHPDLPAVIRAARTIGYSSITVDTNGYLFNDFISKVTASDIDFLSFSLDGPSPEINDAIRGKGSFDRCINGIKQASERGFSISLIYTVGNYNINAIWDMPEILSKLNITKNIRRFFIQVIGIRGRSASASETDNNQQVSKEKWLETIPEVATRVAKLSIPVIYPKVFLRPDEKFECAGMVADNYFIFPNGRVYRCPICEDYPIHSLSFFNNELKLMPPINESNLFGLNIPEGCVMNKLIQPNNISYSEDGVPLYKIGCCLLKEELS